MRKSIACWALLLAILVPRPAPAYLLNLSARLDIPPPFLNENVTSFIGGFIIGSQKSRTVLIRALGPSLADFGLVPLADPTMTLYDATGAVIASNDNWMDTQADEIAATGLIPGNPLESAILITLDPGSYTAIVQGKKANLTPPVATSGTALVEIYDLGFTATLLNISARGAVRGAAVPMIAGFIIGAGSDNTIVIRAIGPSLANFGLSGLSDPRLDVFDIDGNLVASNNNWQDSQSVEIANTGLAPSDPLESAILINLARGAYTAVLSPVDGQDHGTALVEIYKIE